MSTVAVERVFDYQSFQEMVTVPADFLQTIVGGEPLLFPCAVAQKGKHLTIVGLGDTGANGVIFINVQLAVRMVKALPDMRRVTGFEPSLIAGFDGQPTQLADVVLIADFLIQDRLCPNLPMVVIDMKHEMIIGRRWFASFDALVDCRRRKVVFGSEGLPTYQHMEDVFMLPRTPDHRRVIVKEEEEEPATIKEEPATITEEPASTERKAMSPPKHDTVQTKQKEDAVRQRITELEQQGPRPQTSSSSPNKGPRVRMRQSKLSDEDQRKMEDALSEAPIPVPPRPSRTDEERTAHWKKMDEVREERQRLRGRDALGEYVLKKDGISWTRHYVDINVVGSDAFYKLAERQGQEISVITLHELDRFIQDKHDEAETMPYDEEELYQKALSQVPGRYHHLLNQFSKAESDRLAPSRPGDDLKIKIQEGASVQDTVGYEPLRRMSLEEAQAAREYILENLDKGFLSPTDAPWASPILMAKKPGGGLRFCVDYRKLNSITEKDRYPLPLIDETMAQLSKASIFTKIDIRQAFHKIRLDAESARLTAFRCRQGAYQYEVMPFGLSNGPANFQRYINNALRGLLDVICCAYVDDIIIFSNSVEEHEQHVEAVLTRLRDAGLQADLKKCEFHVTKTKFLGFIVGTDGISTDPEKIVAVQNWKPPGTVKGVQSFLGFCNFYRKFVPEYSRVAKPLTALTKKGEGFTWTMECDLAFEELKRLLTTAPVLAHFRYGLPTRLETDASDGVVAGVLHQLQDGEWRPVGYYSETMIPAEMNYPIHDMELLAIVRSLEFWRAELIGLQTTPFEIITDHKALIFFSTKRLLNRRQANWAGFLAQFHFNISYRPGSENVVADAMTREADDIRSQKDRREEYRTIRIFKHEGGPSDVPDVEDGRPSHTKPVDVFSLDICDELDTTLICELFDLEPDALVDLLALEGVAGTYDEGAVAPPAHEWTGPELVNTLMRTNREHPSLEAYREKARRGLADFGLQDGQYVTYQGRLIVPEYDDLRTKVIRDIHGTQITAHPGKHKTKELVQDRYWWPNLSGDVARYVSNCWCRSAKFPRDKTPGLLHPLPIPQRPWQHLVVDFKVMPKDKSGCDNLLVMIDRLSKTSWCVPCTRTATAVDAARMYYEGPFRVFGLPESIVSDQGGPFISFFMKEICRVLGIDWRLSSAGHSQSHGQVENLNAHIDTRLRLFVNHYQDNWVNGVPALDFTQACLPHDSLGGLTPFEVRCGYKPRMHFDWQQKTEEYGSAQERVSRMQASEAAKTMQGYIDVAREAMKLAQDRMARQSNLHRREPDFEIGDHVFIVKKTYTTDRPTPKLDFPLTRNSYRIASMEGYSYVLSVPPSWKGTKVFHADRLRKDPKDPLPGQEYPRPPADVVGDEEEWEVEAIQASRVRYKTLQYQVSWVGWDPDPEWYPAENFRNSPLALKVYHDRYPAHAGPPVRLQQWIEAALTNEPAQAHVDDNMPCKAGPPLRRSVRRMAAVGEMRVKKQVRWKDEMDWRKRNWREMD